MKTGIHPDYMATKVHCNGCGINFETHSTVPEITVEICSNCHPFYTGKQKLVDTAGRVDRFKAQREQAAKLKAQAKPKKVRKPSNAIKTDSPLDAAALVAKNSEDQKIQAELKSETVNLPKTSSSES